MTAKQSSMIPNMIILVKKDNQYQQKQVSMKVRLYTRVKVIVISIVMSFK